MCMTKNFVIRDETALVMRAFARFFFCGLCTAVAGIRMHS